LVFATKYRHEVFSSTHLNRLEEIMYEVSADFETEPTGFNGDNDHIHLLVTSRPRSLCPAWSTP
jgi:putative transposase